MIGAEKAAHWQQKYSGKYNTLKYTRLIKHQTVAGCLGTSDWLWALKVILNTLENNFGNTERLLEI